MKQEVDVILFMGQSNMAGRGVLGNDNPEPAPAPLLGAGYEYRAETAPDRLSAIAEPFGKDENRADGIDDGERKTGSLVTAFINAYFQGTKTPVVAISASQGGTSILEWQPGGSLLEDAKDRLQAGSQYLAGHGFCVRHVYMAWCQGETDGDQGMEGPAYRMYFERMLTDMKMAGAEACLLIRIGQYNGDNAFDYRPIMDAQTQLSKEHPDVVLVSADFAAMKKRGGMKDAFHYYQWVYNEVGEKAGRKAGMYVNTGVKPV